MYDTWYMGVYGKDYMAPDEKAENKIRDFHNIPTHSF